MTPEKIEKMFTNAAGEFALARWGRPLAPVVFGVDDATVGIFHAAITALAPLGNLTMSETDPELGSNFMWFFLRDWSELSATPDLHQLVPELPDLVARLQASNATGYRLFRFDDKGAIKACFVFLRMDQTMLDQPAEDLALAQVVQSLLTWGIQAFHAESPLAKINDVAVVRPEIASLIAAVYDPVLPVASSDKIHALRLAARMAVTDAA